MKRRKIAVVSTLALSLAIGGFLWGNYQVQAVETQTVAESRTFSSGKIGGGGLVQWGEKLAAYLQQEPSDLQDRLQAQTVAEIAEAQGVSRQTMKEQIVTWINEGASDAAERVLDAKGGMKHRGKAGFCFGKKADLETLAGSLGMTADELQSSLRSGTSIADIAEEKSVEVQSIIDTLVTAMTAALDQNLAAGNITQEQYDVMKPMLSDKVTKVINGEGGFGGYNRHGWENRGGGKTHLGGNGA